LQHDPVRRVHPQPAADPGQLGELLGLLGIRAEEAESLRRVRGAQRQRSLGRLGDPGRLDRPAPDLLAQRVQARAVQTQRPEPEIRPILVQPVRGGSSPAQDGPPTMVSGTVSSASSCAKPSSSLPASTVTSKGSVPCCSAHSRSASTGRPPKGGPVYAATAGPTPTSRTAAVLSKCSSRSRYAPRAAPSRPLANLISTVLPA
jgi:hypothetical protein